MWMCGLLLVNGIDAERFSVLDVINNKFLYNNIQQLFYYYYYYVHYLPVIGVKKQQHAAWKNKKTGIKVVVN